MWFCFVLFFHLRNNQGLPAVELWVGSFVNLHKWLLLRHLTLVIPWLCILHFQELRLPLKRGQWTFSQLVFSFRLTANFKSFLYNHWSGRQLNLTRSSFGLKTPVTGGLNHTLVIWAKIPLRREFLLWKWARASLSPAEGIVNLSCELPGSLEGTGAAQPAVIINWDWEGDHVDWFPAASGDI